MSNGNIFPIRQDLQQGAQGPDPGQQGWGWSNWGGGGGPPQIWPGPGNWDPQMGWGHSPGCHGMEGFRHGFGCCCPQCKPVCPPPNFCVVPCPPRAITGPIVGVTDGSDAAPGMVGEFNEYEADVQFAAYPANTQVVASLGVVQPGDWDMTVTGGPQGGNLRALDFFLSPKPLGMSNEMRGVLFVTTVPGNMFTGIQDSVVMGQFARGSFAVPTLLAFNVTMDNSGDPTSVASVVRLVLTARRMR